MTMTIDANQQRYGHLHFDNMSSYPNHTPHFTNPWASTTAPSSHALYVGSQSGLASNSMGLDRHSQQPPSRTPATTTAPMAPYASVPVTSASAGSSLSMVDPSLVGQPDLLSVPQDLLSINRMPHPTSGPSYAESAYTTAASPVHATYAASPSSYEGMGYPPSSVRHNFGLAPDADPHRRYSQSSVSSGASYDHQIDGMPPAPRSSVVDYRNNRAINDDRRSFQDAIEASHGMLSMKFDTSNQETPRAGVYNNRGRGSGDSYGFPSTHSTSSSVSSTGFSPYYGSVDGSVSDYSTAGSDIETVGSRTLPRPQGLMHTQPPAPQSMMGQFSSKVSSSSQKKHKCKVCDKRFTRPSSLQTHMYSHTGEKPFKCEVEGCGRNFSVVSNLRRHRKVHKGEARSDAGSEDHQSD
ncbi:hypothetical protein VM1G_02589 [Cytospora mali]|uniref:C2H2-type domain-containing protein n=1 Tax=Cytospora mali TaxID=578113 RepID=A0A194VTK7_CYTMA|nr:hypothetical protein VM1G_02589 [Valsa mali]